VAELDRTALGRIERIANFCNIVQNYSKASGQSVDHSLRVVTMFLQDVNSSHMQLLSEDFLLVRTAIAEYCYQSDKLKDQK